MNGASEVADVPGRLLGQLVDAVEDVVYVVDADGEPVFWNDQLEATTGYATAEIAELEPQALLRPGQREGALDVGEAIEATGDRRIVLDLVTRDGEAIPHEFRGTTVEDPETGRVYTCAVARDVSDREVRGWGLERYETVVESLEDGVYVLDEELTFSFVNDGLCELLGRSREELLGTDPRELMVDDDQRDVASAIREQVVRGDADTGTLEATIETPDGEHVEVESRYRLLGTAEDGEFPGTAGVIRDVTERNRQAAELGRQRALLQGILNTIPDVVFAFDEEFRPLAPEFMLEEFAGYTAAELQEMSPLEVIAEADRDEIAARMAGALETGVTVSMEAELIAANGRRIPYEFRGMRLEDEDGEVIGLVGTGRDISRRVERERALEQRREELATLNRINELLLDITRDLVESSSRRAIEQTICDRLAESDLYRFAWIGERELDGDRVVPRVSAGEDEGYVDDLIVTADETGDGRGPGGAALRTGEVQVANVDDPAFEPWREAAEARDVRSIAAVPLRHGDTVYGVLAVYATRPDAFSEREQAAFRILGETVGFVVNAVKRRKLLFADAVTELELELGDGESLLPRLSRVLDCTIHLDGYVDAGERWVLYLDVDGEAPDAVVDELAGGSSVEYARVISDQRDRTRVEVAHAAPALLDAAAAVGATVTEARATRSGARAVLEVPVEVDVRETVELLTDRLDGATLLARRERDRRTGRPDGPSGPLEDLTPRQREAVTVAYRAGYYDWPRGSTAEEVADALDIAPATLHAHLRKAERTLLDALLEPGLGRPD